MGSASGPGCDNGAVTDDTPALDPRIAALLTRTATGLVPAVVQDATSGRVLMMAWMNDDALHRTLTTGRGTYWSRSRNKLWVKGEESGHVQHVRRIELDCDGDTVLIQVDQVGPACHNNTPSCFDTHLLLDSPVSDHRTEEARR